MNELGQGNDKVGVGVRSGIAEAARAAKKVWRIRKYENEQAFLNDDPFEEAQFEGNVLLNEGIAALQNLLIGDAEQAFDNSNASLGVGNDGSTAEDATQTGLQGATTTFAGMESGYPSISGQTTTWRAVFGGTEANHDWQEFCVNNGADDSADTLNRKTSDQGTKASGQIWTLDLEITFS